MYGNGQGSASTRVAISVIVLYALVLQAYIAAAAPALGFDPAGSARCAPGEARQDLPGTNSDHHCLCCVLACAACACAFAATASGPVLPQRQSTAVTFALVQASADCARLRLNFAARGPPQDL